MTFKRLTPALTGFLWLKRTSIFLVILSMSLFFKNAEAQEKITADPPEAVALTAVPDSLKDENAVLTDYHKMIEYDESYQYITVRQRIRILSVSARDEYSKFVIKLNNYRDEQVALKAWTIKKDGRVLNVDSNEILKKKTDANLDGFEELTEYKIALPDVETGDEIDVYSMKKVGFLLSTNGLLNHFDDPYVVHKIYYHAFEDIPSDPVFLHSQLPCLHSSMIIRTTPFYIINYRCYNGFPTPQIYRDTTQLYLKFEATGIRPIGETNNSCLECDLPYLSYRILPYKMPVHSRYLMSWAEVFSYCADRFDPEDAMYWNKKNFLFDYFEKNIKPLADSGKFYQFKTFYNYVRENTICKPLTREQSGFCPGYYLSEGFMDKVILMKIYRKMFLLLDIPYSYCIVRDKQRGPFDMNYFRKDEFSNILLAFNDEKGTLHLIQSHDYDNTYDIDEVNPDYRGTVGVLLKMNPELTLNRILIPEHSLNDNFIMTVEKASISRFDSVVKVHGKTTLSGDYSTAVRPFLIMMDTLKKTEQYRTVLDALMKKGMEMDSIQLNSRMNNYPYTFKFSFTNSINNKLQQLDDSLYHFPLKGLIKDAYIAEFSSDRVTDIHYPFCYSSTFKLMLNFDDAVEILNKEKFNVRMENENISYTSSIARINEHAFLLNSVYTLKNETIARDKIKEFNEVVKSATEISEQSLIYRIIKN